MARKIETERRSAGGLEATLEAAAIFVFSIGCVSAITMVCIFQLGGLAASIGILFNSFIGYLLLRSIGEIIRLLKKSVDLPFSGQISQGKQYSVFSCSECNSILHSGLRCDSCGAEIDAD
jgi:hypothetical protein